MSRGTVVYVGMFILLGIGLWATLRFGSRLNARPDLGGVWEIQADDEESQQVLGDNLVIDQSGRYYRLRFESGRAIDLTLTSERTSGSGSDRWIELKLLGPGWQLWAEGQPGRDEMRMALQGRSLRTFSARRTQRTYPFEVLPPPDDEPLEKLEPAPHAAAAPLGTVASTTLPAGDPTIDKTGEDQTAVELSDASPGVSDPAPTTSYAP